MSTHINNQEAVKKFPGCTDYYEICNRAEGKNSKTINWYSVNLRHFRSYLQSRYLPDSIDSIDIKLLREYVFYLLKRNKFDGHLYTSVKTEPLSTTIHGHIRTLRAFFSRLVIEGLIQSNVARGLKAPKISQQIVTTLSGREIESIFNTLSPPNLSEVRNRTIFMILLDSGLRIGEFVNLKMEDVHMDDSRSIPPILFGLVTCIPCSHVILWREGGV